MQRIQDWQIMPNDDRVVELDPGDMVISAAALEDILITVGAKIDRAKYYKELPTLDTLEEIRDELKLLHISGEQL